MFGVPNADLGEEVKAVVQLVPGPEIVTELIAFCGHYLARYKLPRSIDFEAELHRLPTGKLTADSAYGSAELLGWLVIERAIAPHIPVFDRSARDDGTFSREDFAYNQEADIYVSPAGRVLTSTGTLVNDGATLLYRASKHDCDACELKSRCCPKMPARKVPRSIYENARDVARDIAKTEAYVMSRRERKKIDILFAHLKCILRLDRLRLRGPFGCTRRVPPRCRGPEPPIAGKADPAARPNDEND